MSSKPVETANESLTGKSLLPGVAIERVFDYAPIGLCVFDDQLRFVYLNQTFADMNGVSLDDHIGRTPMEVVPDLGQQAEAALRKVLETGEPLLNFEFVGETHADPGVIHVWEESWKPLTNSSGQIVGISVVSVDITQRKRMQTQLRQSETEALALVEQLRKEDQSKNSFIASLSHELRNPLAAIVASLDLMNATCNSDRKVNHICDILRRQTLQLTHLVNDLLDVTRINSNKIALIIQPLDLVSLVQTIVDDQVQRFQERDVTLTYSADAERIEIMADRVRLTQVIGNLMDNAFKFTKAGDRVDVSIRRNQTAREAVIAIADTGIGLSPDQLGSLFHPFFQAQQPLDRVQSGLGLGLCIVKGIVELHNGRVTVDSEGLGKGARFTIHLPI